MFKRRPRRMGSEKIGGKIAIAIGAFVCGFLIALIVIMPKTNNTEVREISTKTQREPITIENEIPEKQQTTAEENNEKMQDVITEINNDVPGMQQYLDETLSSVGQESGQIQKLVGDVTDQTSGFLSSWSFDRIINEITSGLGEMKEMINSGTGDLQLGF